MTGSHSQVSFVHAVVPMLLFMDDHGNEAMVPSPFHAIISIRHPVRVIVATVRPTTTVPSSLVKEIPVSAFAGKLNKRFMAKTANSSFFTELSNHDLLNQ
jgi:hypothetical protein